MEGVRDFKVAMSQVPIREAIRRRQTEGWVTYRNNSGREIANIGLEFLVAAVLSDSCAAAELRSMDGL
jgi:DNA-binding FadR family transcriptional regulator